MRAILVCLFAFLVSATAHADFVNFVGSGGEEPPLESSCSGSPDYFWIDDGDQAGTWDNSNTANWSATTGGAGGAGPPTSADDVCFDENSGAGTVTIAATGASLITEVANFTGTISHPSATTWTVYGNLIFDTEFTYSKGSATTSTLSLAGATAASVTSAGKTFGNVSLATDSKVVTLQDAFVSSGTITHTRGTFDTNDKTVTATAISSSASTTRTLDLGSSTINLSSTGNAWLTATTTGLTFDAGTSVINLTASTSATFSGGGLTFYNATFTGSNTLTIAGANTFNNLTVTPGVTQSASVQLQANQTISGTFTVTGNSATNRLLVNSDAAGTARTITAAAVSVDAVDFEDITGAGAASWDMSAAVKYVGLCGNTSGLTGTTPDELFWIGGTGNWTDTAEWSTSSGGAGGARSPVCSDTAVFDANSFGSGGLTSTIDRVRLPSIDASAATNSPTFAMTTIATVYGDFVFPAGVTVSGTQNYTFSGRGSHTFIMSGTWVNGKDLFFTAPGGTYTLGANFNGAGVSTDFEHISGTFDFNGFNAVLGTLNSDTTNTRTLLLGSGTIEVTTTTAAVDFAPSTGLTFDAETSQIYLSATTGNTTFIGGSLTFNDLRLGTKATGEVNISGSNTFADILVDAPHPGFEFTASTTQTVTGSVTCTGSAGNVIEWRSSSTTNASVTGGIIITCDYANISDITCVAGTTCSTTNGTCSDATNWVCP